MLKKPRMAFSTDKLDETTGCRGPLQMLKSRALIGNFASLPGEDCRN
jgi:hypothetical protein